MGSGWKAQTPNQQLTKQRHNHQLDRALSVTGALLSSAQDAAVAELRFPRGDSNGDVGGESRDSHEDVRLMGIYSVPEARLSPDQTKQHKRVYSPAQGQW